MARINSVKGADSNADVKAAVITEAKADATVQVFDQLELPKSVRSGGKSKYPWIATKIGGGFFVPEADVKTFYTLCSTQNKKTEDAKYIARKWTGEGGIEGVMVFKRPKD